MSSENCYKNIVFIKVGLFCGKIMFSVTFCEKKRPVSGKKPTKTTNHICPLTWQIFTSLTDPILNVKAGGTSCCCSINQWCVFWLSVSRLSETRQEFLLLPFKPVLMKAAKLLFLLPLCPPFRSLVKRHQMRANLQIKERWRFLLRPPTNLRTAVWRFLLQRYQAKQDTLPNCSSFVWQLFLPQSRHGAVLDK